MTRKQIDAGAARRAFESALDSHDQAFGTFFLARLLGFEITYEADACSVVFEVHDFMFNPQGTLHDYLAMVSLVSDADTTKKATFSLAGISAGTTRSFTLPNTSSELAILAGTQTFSGNKTFSGTLTASGTVTVSAASASIGTATTTATYGMGTGATTTGVTKTVNIGTGGASG